jgi:hypothetical protein
MEKFKLFETEKKTRMSKLKLTMTLICSFDIDAIIRYEFVRWKKSTRRFYFSTFEMLLGVYSSK